MVAALCLTIVAGIASEPSMAIAIQPLGSVRAADVRAARDGVERFYKCKTKLLAAVPLPKSAYYAPRNRYRADRLLDFLSARRPRDCDKILGITAKDISASVHGRTDWGIFGLGHLDGPACVVSTYRMRSKSSAVFAKRLFHIVNHEVGHTVGLGHCPAKGCLMEDAAGSVRSVDEWKGWVCGRCRKTIR